VDCRRKFPHSAQRIRIHRETGERQGAARCTVIRQADKCHEAGPGNAGGTLRRPGSRKSMKEQAATFGIARPAE